MPQQNNQAPTFFRPSSIYIFGGFAVVACFVYYLVLKQTMGYEEAFFAHQNLLKSRDENLDPNQLEEIAKAIKFSEIIIPAFKNMTNAEQMLNASKSFVIWFPYIATFICGLATWMIQGNFPAPNEAQNTEQIVDANRNAPAM